jgi:hypothetical protein
LYVPYWISNQPPYSISTGAMLAPPTREQWYLLASPFLSEADGTKGPHPPSAGGIGGYVWMGNSR